VTLSEGIPLPLNEEEPALDGCVLYCKDLPAEGKPAALTLWEEGGPTASLVCHWRSASHRCS